MSYWDVLAIATAQTCLLLALVVAVYAAGTSLRIYLGFFLICMAALATGPIYNSVGSAPLGVRAVLYTFASATPISLALLAVYLFADRDFGRWWFVLPAAAATAIDSYDFWISASQNWPVTPGMILIFEYLPQLEKTVFVMVAIAAIFFGINGDLVAGRHRLRLWAISALSIIAIEMVVLENFVSVAVALPYDPTRFHQLWQAVFAMWLAMKLLSPASVDWVQLRARRPAPPAREGIDWHAKSAQLAKLAKAGDLFREETLDMEKLARALGLPVYRLRQLLNEHEGYRNFHDFLGDVRVRIAREDLADPEKRHLPILTIAFDAGFGSLAPFNRAFKARTGLTPSEWRRTNAPRELDGGGTGR